MRNPLDNPKITQEYWNYMPQWYAYSGGYHTGIDYGAPQGTPIKAVTDGTTVAVGYDSGFGNYVLISHNNSFYALYGHMSGFAVGNWQHVTEGQVIGYVGSTGFSTGSHLHFETKTQPTLYANWTNPNNILNNQGGSMEWYDIDIAAKAKEIAALKERVRQLELKLADNWYIKDIEAKALEIANMKVELQAYKKSNEADAKSIKELMEKLKKYEGQPVPDTNFIIEFFNKLKTWFKN